MAETGMFLKYGTHSHAIAEAAIGINRDVLLTGAQTPYAYLERWDIDGFLTADSAAEIKTAIEALEDAYATDGLDIVMMLPDGISESSHKIDSSATNGGVRITRRPSFPTGRDGEHSTFRTYGISLEAEIKIANPATALRDFSETISFSGGGPKFGHLEPNVGIPQKQKLKQNTVFKAVQSGTATGLYVRPNLPYPIWPQALVSPIGYPVTKTSPRRVGTGSALTHMDWGIQWSYEFESTYALIGNPTLWPT